MKVGGQGPAVMNKRNLHQISSINLTVDDHFEVSGSDKSVADTYMFGADGDIPSVWTMAPLRNGLLVNRDS